MPWLPLRSRLAVDDLRACIRDTFEDLANHKSEDLRAMVKDPGIRAVTLRMSLGTHVAANLIGAVHGASSTLRSVSGKEFFQAVEGVLTQFRTERFGEVLFNIQGVPGFEEWIADFPQVPASELAKMLTGRFAEIDTAGMMMNAGVLLSLRARTNKPGDNYDCDLLVDGIEVAAEIKAKADTTNVSPRTIQRTIEEACEQLPASKPGVVWLNIPHAWTQSPVVQLNLDVAMIAVRQLPRPPIAVVAHWQWVEGLAVGKMYNLMSCAVDSKQAALAKELDEALLAQPATGTWVSFHTLVDEFITAQTAQSLQ